jgi:hypothetical protein
MTTAESYQLPDFATITTSQFPDRFAQAMAAHQAEIHAIATNPEAPNWENTVEAWERSGQELEQVSAVFFNLLNTDKTAELEQIAATLAPQLAAHSDSIYLNNELYQRIVAAQPPKDNESQRLHDYLIRSFKRHGTGLDPDSKKTLADINQRLSALKDTFNRNLAADTTGLAAHFPTEAELRGLSQSRLASARHDAAALGKPGYVLPLELPSVQSAQAQLELAASRAKLYDVAASRGVQSNAEVVVEMAQLRAKRAELLGFASHADYVIAEETAGSAAAARRLLLDLAPAAATNARNELKLLEEAAGDEPVTAADWPYWEAVIKARDYQIDETKLRQYFPLNQVLEDGVFFAANQLYGITVEKRPDLHGYAPDVDVWEVKEESGTGIGVLLTDYYARASKRGGAWMSSFVSQSQLLDRKPVVVNVMSITKPADGSQPLLSLDEVRTMFHEFGHGLHGLLSNVRYPSFSGTKVPRDYVEFPSQINENWAFEPAIVKNYARHVDTSEVIPDQLLAAVERGQKFGQGFATVEYLAAAIIDLAWHSLSASQAAALSPADVTDFENQALALAGLDMETIAPRYRSTYFSHIFGGGYSAGYYSYLWAEVLDADGFEWFNGQQLREAGQRFRELVLARGGADDYTKAFETLRGRAKDITPLLKRRGLEGAV